MKLFWPDNFNKESPELSILIFNLILELLLTFSKP